MADGITLRAVTYRYPGSSALGVAGVDVHLPAGATVGIVGPNGAGKTTLTKVLLGLVQPAEGEILIDGTPLAEQNRAAWAARAGGIFQDFVKPMFTARECVAWGDLSRIGDQAALEEAARLGRADTVIRSLPAAWDTPLGGALGGRELSEGQWQRLALARGFLAESPLLFVVDEPAADLDPQAEYDVFRHIRDWGAQAAEQTGCITVLVTHRFSTVRAADLILVMDGGRILESGTHDALMRAGGTYRRNYDAQELEYR
jgi:ATP-binding cassette subfamily B protein